MNRATSLASDLSYHSGNLAEQNMLAASQPYSFWLIDQAQLLNLKMRKE